MKNEINEKYQKNRIDSIICGDITKFVLTKI